MPSSRPDPSPARQDRLAALAEAPQARAAFERMPPSRRDRRVAHVTEGKRAEARPRRIERCVAELAQQDGKGADVGYSGTPLPRKLGVKDRPKEKR